MATDPQKTSPLTTIPLGAPALLLVGSPAALQEQVIGSLQTLFCKHNNCKSCTTCSQIRTMQHHAILWCAPTGNNYTIADIDAIFERTQFALEPDEDFFVIITHADRMPSACANRLLKTLEEPPLGYHFILCSQSAESILPTIQSRCMTLQLEHQSSTPPLWDYFVATTADPLAFLQALQTTTVTEHDTTQLINELSSYWSRKYQELVHAQHKTEHVEQRLDILSKALEQPVAPGSSKIVLRNLYILLLG